MSAFQQNPTLASTCSIISPSSILDFPIIYGINGRKTFGMGGPYIHLIVNHGWVKQLPMTLWSYDPPRIRPLWRSSWFRTMGGAFRICENFFVEDWSYCWWKKFDMVNILFLGFHTSQVVQDFFHQQYVFKYFSPKMAWKISGTCIIVHQKMIPFSQMLAKRIQYVYMFPELN